MSDPLLNASEIAEALHCSRGHVYNLALGRVSGVPPLPLVKIGKRVLVRKSSLERWIAEREGNTIALGGVIQ